MTRRRTIALWGAVTVTGVLLAFAPVVAGLRTLSQRDTDTLYAPVRTLVVEELRAGRLPLWDPYQGTGKPLFAEGIHSVLHPISLAAAALAPSSIDFLILAYLVAASLGAFALARTLGASPPAAAGAGLAYALSGYSVSMAGNLVFLAGLSTLPWLVASARAAGAGARWGAVWSSLAAASAFLSGDAQVAVVGLALGVAVAVDAGGIAGGRRALLGMGAGVLLAGVQLATTQGLLPLTYRSLGLSPEEKTRWALAPGRLLEWLLPGLFRGPLSEVPVDAAGNWLPPVFAESVYLGAPLLLAASLGAVTRRSEGRRRTGLLLAAAAGLLLWLALGHWLGARQALDWIPIWNRFRYTEKLTAPLTLCVAALGALGVDAFGDRPLPRVWALAIAALGVTAGAALLALHVAPLATQAAATRLLGSAGPFYRYTLASALPHLLACLAALLALDRLRAAPARTIGLALLVTLAPAAAVRFAAHFGSPELRRFASPLRLECDSPVPRLLQPLDRIQDGDDPLGPIEAAARIETTLMARAVNVALRVDNVEPYGAFDSGRFTTVATSLGADFARSFRRFALTHVDFQRSSFSGEPARSAPGSVAGARLVQRDEALGFELWEVPHRPWAFFPARAVAAPRSQEALRVLLDLVARGEDTTVVVESPEPPPTAPGSVLRVERGTASLRVEAESAGPSLLVVQDAWWPGWRASIDGSPTPILAADVLVRAVRWPAGRHTLQMTYAPPELRTGLVLSALGALALAALATLAARPRRARRSAGDEP